MGKISVDTINAAYDVARRVYANQLTEVDAVSELVGQQAMNPASALIYVRNLRSMLNGITFKRTMSARSFAVYLDRISDDFGSIAARAALASVRGHIEYYNSLGRGNLNEVAEVCNIAAAKFTRADRRMTIWTISAQYDDQAHVWYSTQGDIPGLNIDAGTIELLAEKAGSMLPDLLEIHSDNLVDKTRLQGPHRIRVVAFHEREYDVAA